MPLALLFYVYDLGCEIMQIQNQCLIDSKVVTSFFADRKSCVVERILRTEPIKNLPVTVKSNYCNLEKRVNYFVWMEAI